MGAAKPQDLQAAAGDPGKLMSPKAEGGSCSCPGHRQGEFPPTQPFCPIQVFHGLDEAHHFGEDNLLYSVDWSNANFMQ